jgi:hypothetical protein
MRDTEKRLREGAQRRAVGRCLLLDQADCSESEVNLNLIRRAVTDRRL